MLDGDQPYPAAPRLPEFGVYPAESNGCGFGDDEAGPEGMGLSVGYADTYSYDLPGQRIDITGVKKGIYCLVSTANPDHGAEDLNQIEESNDANNARRQRVKIKPKEREVHWLDRKCNVGAP